MIIRDWNITEQESTKEVSVDIEGFRLWYRLPKSFPITASGDPFLAAALLPAMVEGKVLEFDSDLSVSPKLIQNLATLQEIHHCWNPVLKVIPIKANLEAKQSANVGVLSFFSGGVDSMFTFLKHASEITNVVYINGFDFFVDPNAFQRTIDSMASFVSGFGKTLIPAETNFYNFGYKYNLSRELSHGSNLASVALLLGFPRVYVPSSYNYNDMAPWGSHPLTDPLYSSDCVEIIHDGSEARRVDKIVQIAGCEPALKNLKVCLEDMERNCGKCKKCLRTMISLHILDCKDTPFPSLPPLKSIQKINWKSEPIFLDYNIDLADQYGRKEIRDALSKCRKRYQLIQFLKDMDRVLFGGIMKNFHRRIMKDPPVVRRITTTPRKD